MVQVRCESVKAVDCVFVVCTLQHAIAAILIFPTAALSGWGNKMNWWIASFWFAFLALIYVQIGYPLLMALLAWLPGRLKAVDNEMPTVTLIIPAFNEEIVAEAKIKNALQIDYPKDRLEIIFASDASSDRTIEIAGEFEAQGVRLLTFSERRGKPSVVNDAVAISKGEILLLCDANVMFRPDALRRLVERLADPEVGAVTGDVRLDSHEANFGQGESLYYKIERMIQLGESRVGSIMSVDGGMYVIRRNLFYALPPDALNEDFTNTMRVIQQGKRVVYEPAAVATENATPTARQEFRRRARVTAGAIGSLKRGERPPLRRPIECWQFVSHKLLRWVGPLFLAITLISSANLWNHGVVYKVAVLGQVVLYGVALVATFSIGFRETGFGGVTFYFVMSHVAIAWGLIKGFMQMPRVTWTKPDRSISRESRAATLDQTMT